MIASFFDTRMYGRAMKKIVDIDDKIRYLRCLRESEKATASQGRPGWTWEFQEFLKRFPSPRPSIVKGYHYIYLADP